MGCPGDRAFSGACEGCTQGPYPLAVDWYWCGFRLGWVGLLTQYSDLLVPKGLSLSVCWLGVKPQAPDVSKSSNFTFS